MSRGDDGYDDDGDDADDDACRALCPWCVRSLVFSYENEDVPLAVFASGTSSRALGPGRFRS